MKTGYIIQCKRRSVPQSSINLLTNTNNSNDLHDLNHPKYNSPWRKDSDI